MYLTESHISRLSRAINDKVYALTKMKSAEPYFSSRTLVEQYSFFVWDFGSYK